MKTQNKFFFLLAASVLLSVSVGLYNNFPITYSDSGAYLYSGKENVLLQYRPIFYGWFLRYTHFNDNLFFSILVQGLISSFVVFLFFKYFSKAKNKDIHFLVAILLLCCFTGYSFYVSFLMPDIFTFILLISLLLLFFANLTKFDFYITACLCIYSITVHNSHFPLIVLCLLILGYLFIIKNKEANRKPVIKKWLLVFSICLISITLSLIVNLSFTDKLFLSRNGHVFFTSRLHELNILESFLNEKCPTSNYVLCPYKDSIPPDFIWDPTSPLYKTGGFENSGPEYSKMILDLVTNMKYFNEIVVSSFVSTLLQLGSFEIEPQYRNINAYIKNTYSVHKLTQDLSFQNRGQEGLSKRLNFEKLNFFQNLVVLGSFSFLSALLLFNLNIDKVHRNLIVFVFWALLFNALICSTFSTVLPRYQGRLIFVLPLLFILIFPGIDWKSLKHLIRQDDGES